jgi:hypothetical protein
MIFVPIRAAARHWKTLLWTIGIGSTFVLITLIFSGIEPYRIFISEIAPALGRPVIRDPNVSLVAFLHRVLNVDALPSSASVSLRIAQVALLLVILIALIARKGELWRIPANACAACVTLLCWLLIFSPILWEHYFAYLAPFYGWLIAEAIRTKWLRPVVAIALILSWFPQKILGARNVPEPINSFLLWAVMLVLIVALRRLIKPGPWTATGAQATR